MMKLSIVLAAVASLLAGCTFTGMDKNPSRIRSPEREAYQACLKKSNNDKAKCDKERQDFYRRQELELMDNNG